eukprot:g13724.t1
MPWRYGLPRVADQVAAVVLALASVRHSIAVDFDGSSYARNVSLSESVDIFWTVDTTIETIQVAVHAKAAMGWAGVGISEMGGMEGADIVFYETATANVTDAHSIVAGRPLVDECTQDWALLSFTAGDGGLVFEAERALDTGDSQDRVFTDDTLDGENYTTAPVWSNNGVDACMKWLISVRAQRALLPVATFHRDDIATNLLQVWSWRAVPKHFHSAPPASVAGSAPQKRGYPPRATMPSWFGFPRIKSQAAAVIFALASVTYAVAVDFDGSSYARNVSLSDSVDMFWTIDTTAETIQVAVHAKAATGWAGVGISEMGGMEGADIVFYETATGNVTDAHSLVAGRPLVDECTQDWTLLFAEAGDGSLVFEVERVLDTGDAQDRVFTDDTQDDSAPTRVLAAWGDDESMEYHGTTDFAKGEIIMFGGAEAADVDPDVVSDPEVSFFDATTTNFTIPTERTWYEDTCITASELPDLDEFHAIAFEGRAQSDTSEYVHHLVLTAFSGTPDCGLSCYEWYSQYSSGDDDGISTDPYSYVEDNNITIPDFCSYTLADIFPWGPGTPDLYLPDDIGFFFGDESGGFTSLNLQTHYNNPNGDEGLVDSSGVRVYYTEELRPIDMGVMKLGDPFIFLNGQPLPDGKATVSFTCPSSCTEENFEAEEVTVFGHFLHMHETGQRLVTRQYRNDSNGNEVMVHSAEVEYYSFLQAAGFPVNTNDSITIQKGDRFETECFYDTALSSVGSENVTFGLGSEQEMCIDYVFYYPNQRLPDNGACGLGVCDGFIDGFSELEVGHDFNRTFGIVDTCASNLAEDGEDPEGAEGADGTDDAEDDASSVLSARASRLGLALHSIAVDFDGSSYARNVSLSESVDIFWTVDTTIETIQVAVHAKAAMGWAGVGISEMGGMEGADIVFYETATANVTDAHSIVAGRPLVDECTQDWALLSVTAGDGGLVFEAERALDTGDSQDRVFTDDTLDGSQPTRLIAAWGDDESMEYHGTADFAKGEVIIFGGAETANVDSNVLSDPGVSFFDVTAKNFTIPAERTWYEDTCFTASELPDPDEFHAIAFEGRAQSDTSEYVHHLVLTGYSGTTDCGLSCDEWFTQYSSSEVSSTDLYAYVQEKNVTIPDFCSFYSAEIFPWGPGTPDFYLPDDVGFLFGNTSGGFTSLNLQIHYNNPNGDEGLVDSSGVRVYYTEELRPMDMGVMKLGDPFVYLYGQPLPDGKATISFTCPSSCTEENFEAEEVTISSHLMHMHETGQRLVTRQYRNDSSGHEVMVHSAEVEYYSFLQAAGFPVHTNDSMTIQKGDRFETECFYDTALSSVGSENVTFGAGSEQEMCIDYVFYYPNQRLLDSGACGFGFCNGSTTGLWELGAGHDFNRTFGIVDDTCITNLAEDVEDVEGAEDADDTEDADDDASAGSSARARRSGLMAFALSSTATLALGGITVA